MKTEIEQAIEDVQLGLARAKELERKLFGFSTASVEKLVDAAKRTAELEKELQSQACWKKHIPIQELVEVAMVAQEYHAKRRYGFKGLEDRDACRKRIGEALSKLKQKGFSFE